MIHVWILAGMMTGGVALMPFDSEDGCRAAMQALPPSIVEDAECIQIEMLAPSSIYAPEIAPLPRPKGVAP